MSDLGLSDDEDDIRPELQMSLISALQWLFFFVFLPGVLFISCTVLLIRRSLGLFFYSLRGRKSCSRSNRCHMQYCLHLCSGVRYYKSENIFQIDNEDAEPVSFVATQVFSTQKVS